MQINKYSVNLGPRLRGCQNGIHGSRTPFTPRSDERIVGSVERSNSGECDGGNGEDPGVQFDRLSFHGLLPCCPFICASRARENSFFNP